MNQIYVDEVPLGNVDHSHFIELVVQHDVRPERPDDDEDERRCSQLTDDVWELAEKCWTKDPKKRPTADSLCDSIVYLLEDRDGKPLLDSSPSMLSTSPSFLSRSPQDSLFSRQSSSPSAPTSGSPSSSRFRGPQPSKEASYTSGNTVTDLWDEFDVFQEHGSFVSESPITSSIQPGDAIICNPDPYRDVARILAPPNNKLMFSILERSGRRAGASSVRAIGREIPVAERGEEVLQGYPTLREEDTMDVMFSQSVFEVEDVEPRAAISERKLREKKMKETEPKTEPDRGKGLWATRILGFVGRTGPKDAGKPPPLP